MKLMHNDAAFREMHGELDSRRKL